jgi:PAS domain-containing protein
MDDETDKVVRSNGNEENLRASEVRYRRLFETAKDGILLLDADTGESPTSTRSCKTCWDILTPS